MIRKYQLIGFDISWRYTSGSEDIEDQRFLPRPLSDLTGNWSASGLCWPLEPCLFLSYLESSTFELNKKNNLVYYININRLGLILVDNIPAAVKILRSNAVFLGRYLMRHQICLLLAYIGFSSLVYSYHICNHPPSNLIRQKSGILRKYKLNGIDISWRYTSGSEDIEDICCLPRPLSDLTGNWSTSGLCWRLEPRLFLSYLESSPFELNEKNNLVYYININRLGLILVDDIPAAVKTLRTNVVYLVRFLIWPEIDLLPGLVGVLSIGVSRSQ